MMSLSVAQLILYQLIGRLLMNELRRKDMEAVEA